MALVPYTITVIERDTADAAISGKQVVVGAVCSMFLQPTDTAALLYDDAEGNGGSTAKTTNANGQVTVYVDAGDYRVSVNGNDSFISLLAGGTGVVETVTETQTLAAAQTVVTLADVTTTSTAFYINGPSVDNGRLVLGVDYTVDTTAQITLTTSYADGTLITAVQNDTTESIKPEIQVFDSVFDMQQSTIEVGKIAKTKGYYTPNDGGGADYLIVASGTGTDDGGSYIDLALNQAELISSGAVNVKQFGAKGDNSTNDTDAINAAIEYASSKGKETLIPEGRFIYTKTDIRFNNITIAGNARPFYNESKTQLVGGSTIVGTLEIKGKNPTIRDLGIDHGLVAFPSTPDNALVLAHQNPFTEQSIATVSNVIALCANVEDPFHAILIEGHFDTNIDNIVGIKSFFGAALKNTRNNISNAIFIDNGSDNLIIKSDLTSGKVDKVNVSNIICQGVGTGGTETTSFNLRLSAFDNDLTNVNISNVVGSDASYVVYLDASGASGGSMSNINISNVIGSTIGRGVLVSGGAGTGRIDNVQFSNMSFKDVDFKVFEANGNVGRLSINGLFSSNVTGSTFTNRTVDIASTVETTEISNIVLCINNDLSDLATINYINGFAGNMLTGNNKVLIDGVGIPREGYSTDSSTGTTITLSPLFTTKNKALIEMNASGTRTVVGISREMPNSARFPYNYELTVINNASGTVIFTHDPAAFIYNKGSVNVAVLPNEMIIYKFFSAVWHQV